MGADQLAARDEAIGRHELVGAPPSATAGLAPQTGEVESGEAPKLAETTGEAGPDRASSETPLPTSEASAGDTGSSGTFIVDDAADVKGPQQMGRTEFLGELRRSLESSVNEALAPTHHSTRDCPYIEYWFSFYSRRTSEHIERAIRRYAPETGSSTNAFDVIGAVSDRARRAADIWARTGTVTGVPEGIPLDLQAASDKRSTPILRKASIGNPSSDEDPDHVRARLGPGRPLDPSVRNRMEGAYGRSFSHVRLHDDAQASHVSASLAARAFTVGSSVAFSAGEYHPGTPVGDALLAHELAHVVQQGAGRSHPVTRTQDRTASTALEEDADKSAANAVGRLWRMPAAMRSFGAQAVPSLRAGLRLQRCSRDTPTPRCVLPDAVLNGPFHAPINEPDTIGMEIAITVRSSSGNQADMAAVEDSEQVGLSFSHTGSFSGMAGIPSAQSGFMAADSIPNDRHGASRAFIVDRADNHGGSGSFMKHQLDIFKRADCGITTPRVIPNSGYYIKRTVTSGSGTQLKFTTEKGPAACTVNGYTTTAGPSPTYSDDVIVRP